MEITPVAVLQAAKARSTARWPTSRKPSTRMPTATAGCSWWSWPMPTSSTNFSAPMTTPSCWKATSTDRLSIGHQEPAAETPRVFSCRSSMRGATLRCVDRMPGCFLRACPRCPRGERWPRKSSRSFRANALVRREIRRRSAMSFTSSSGVVAACRTGVAMTCIAAFPFGVESLRAALLLARRQSGSHARMRVMRALRASMHCDAGVARGCRERAWKKLRERLLTPEKSVIRFRPADISCGSK